jgi:hypothetical protein
MAVTKCEFCGMYLPSEANVERHQRAVHQNTDAKNDRIEV